MKVKVYRNHSEAEQDINGKDGEILQMEHVSGQPKLWVQIGDQVEVRELQQIRTNEVVGTENVDGLHGKISALEALLAESRAEYAKLATAMETKIKAPAPKVVRKTPPVHKK